MNIMATKKRILTNPDFVIFCETRNIKSETVKLYDSSTEIYKLNW